MSELIHRINCHSSLLSSFHFDHDGGAITLHRAVELPASGPSPQIFIDALDRSAYPLKIFEAVIPFLESPGHAKPRTILSSALLLAGDVDDEMILSKKKTVIKLVH